MKSIKVFITIFSFFCICFGYSQKSISTTIIEPFQKEALYREKVFIHTNKSVYFVNESIWFSSYIAEDSDNKPSNYTSNLLVNLLNQKGEVLVHQNIFIKNGVGNGNILIDNNLETGDYYIQASTNFMMNFGKENAFIQKIKVINPSKKESEKIATNNSYDIQVFPESGYLLEDVQNSIGIKAIINNKGYPFKGTILDSKGNEITTFKGNSFGMGKCEFFYSKNESYTAVVHINNTIQKIQIPKANKTGVNLKVDNSNPEQIKLSLITNNESIPLLKNDSLALLIYRNNYISEAATLSITSSKQLTQDLLFDKGKLQNGLNIVTLFRNNQPIAERKFFVNKLDEQTAILVEKMNSINDSISFKIKTVNEKYKGVVSQISISVITEDSKVFTEKQNIKSAFLLSPYIKGNIENPAYYFKNTNPVQIENLDLLLLNQGWSVYSLEDKINEINPKGNFTFENGFTIKGKIKKKPKGYDIGVISKENKLTTYSEFNKNKEFLFENIYAYKNDSVTMALIKKGSSLVKPNQIEFIEDKSKPQNYSYLINSFKQPKVLEEDIIKSEKERNPGNFQYPNTELIDEVVLNARVAKKKITFYDKEMNLAQEHNEIASEFFQSKKVTKQMEISSHTLFEYFKGLGYIKSASDGGSFISLRNAPVTFFGENKNPDNTYPPKIYIDNVSVPNGDIQTLKSLYMFDIDEILINKSGAGGGIDGMGGIIKIYLKKGNHQYLEEKSKNLYTKLLLLTGFDKAKSYYNPQYNIYTKENLDWTEIDWKPRLKTNNNGETIINIPNNKYTNNFVFIINGFSESGLLFHDVYNINPDEF